MRFFYFILFVNAEIQVSLAKNTLTLLLFLLLNQDSVKVGIELFL